MRRLRGERTVAQLDGRPQDSASTAVLDEAERRDIEPGRTRPVRRAVGAPWTACWPSWSSWVSSRARERWPDAESEQQTSRILGSW